MHKLKMACFRFLRSKLSNKPLDNEDCSRAKDSLSSPEDETSTPSKHDQQHPPVISTKKVVSKASVKHLARLFKELECPVCYNTCVPPIETCRNGHIICATCRSHMSNCPTCRERFTGTRNFFAENFINQYAQHCRFKEDGCEYLRWKGENMGPHEATCQFRDIKCIVPTCNKSLTYRSLLEHLVQQHNIGGSDTLPTLIFYDVVDPIVTTRKWLPYYIQAYGNIFYVMMEVVRPCFYIWVWIQETKKENLNNDFIYVTGVRFQSAEKTMVHSWEGPVHSIRTSACQIKKDGLCLIIPESVMQHFEKDSRISMELNLEKRKVPTLPSASPMSKPSSETNLLPEDVLNVSPENPHYPSLNLFSGDNFTNNNNNNSNNNNSNNNNHNHNNSSILTNSHSTTVPYHSLR